jgi:hypothetical protein
MEGPFVPHDNRLQLALVDIAAPVADALSAAVTAAGLNDVEVVCGSLFDVDADAVVSPGNSLGFMDGGVDLTCVLRLANPWRTGSGQRSVTTTTGNCWSARH